MSDTLSEAELQAIEARANAATPGPWAWEPRGVWTENENGFGGPVLDLAGEKDRATGTIGYVGDEYPRGINYPSQSMEFIAHAREDVPALVAALRESREQLAARDAQIARLRQVVEGAEVANVEH